MRLGLIVVLGIGLIPLAPAARSSQASWPGQIAFAVENHTTHTAAYRATLGGSERRIHLQAGELRVSPRGSRIAFTVYQRGGYVLWVMRADGSGARRLTGVLRGGDGLQPAWSPDGRSIAVGSEDGVFKVNLAPHRVQRIAPGGSFPAWSPDGRTIAFIWGLRLRDVSAAGGVVRLLHLRAEPQEDAPPVWLSNRRILIGAGRGLSLRHGVYRFRFDIYSVPSRRGHARQLTHFWRFATKGGVVWSPRARRIAFAANGKLWTVALDGTDRRRATAPPSGANDSQPVWSPDGKRLAFLRETALGARLFVVRSTGGKARLVTDGKRISVGRASWDRHGRSLVYPLTLYRGDSINVIELGNRSIRPLTRSPWNDSEPSWSPDGSSIAFTRDLVAPGEKEIFRMDADGTDVKRLTHHALEDSSPSWSPSGKQIVFFHDTNQSWVATMDAKDGHHLNRIFRGRTSAWSPDGKTIAVGGNDRLILVTPAGEVVRELAVRVGTVAAWPTWSPDGKRIAFTRLVGCGDDCVLPSIEIVSVDGGEPADFENRAFMPSWSPDGSEIAYVCSTRSICRKPVGGGSETVVWQGSREEPASSPSWRP